MSGLDTWINDTFFATRRRAYVLRGGDPLRRVVFADASLELREQLREYNELAISQASLYRYSNNPDWAWRGFQDGRTWAFIRSGNILEEWPSAQI